MATKTTGITADTAARIPASRDVIAQEVSRQLNELAETDSEFDVDDREMSSADRISEALQSDLGERAYVRVSKIDERTGQKEFCKDYTPQEFEHNGNELIRSEWGYGKFHVVLYGTVPGTKRFTIRASTQLSFARPLTPNAVAVQPQQQNSELTQILALLAKGQQDILQALTNRETPDPTAQLTATLGLMTQMREAMGLTAQQPQKSSIGEIIDAIKEIKGVQSIIGDGGEKEPSMMSMASEVLAVVKPMIEQRAQQSHAQPDGAMPQLTVPASLQSEAPMPLIERNTPQFDEDDEDMLELMLFRAILKKHVIPAAGDDARVAEVAELLEEKAPDQLVELFEQPNWFDVLKQFAPQVMPVMVPVIDQHPAWLVKVRDHLLTLLKDEG